LVTRAALFGSPTEVGGRSDFFPFLRSFDFVRKVAIPMNVTDPSTLSLKAETGVPGLDEVLGGGLPKNHLYLLQGHPGTGKTTMALQFLLEGARRGEKTLYVTFSETKQELETVAHSHGWDLRDLSILELSAIVASVGKIQQSTLFHPSELELTRVIDLLLNKVKEVEATRIVFDSVSELRLLAETSLRYRRQMLAFKEFFIDRGSTVLFLDDLTTEAGDVHVQSIVHGVLLLEKLRASYGVERRQFHIVKLRGVPFRGGTHDYLIQHGGIRIFPRLVANNHVQKFARINFSSGVPALDSLLGGGLDSGTSNLIMGPAGTGKSTISLRFAVSAAERGQKCAIYNFEESLANLRERAIGLGIDLDRFTKSGLISLRKVDPAELTPGQFASLLREASDKDKVDLVVIDSLNGYIHAMPEQQFLPLQLHELLAYLNNKNVLTIMVLAQAGVMGNMSTPIDLTYLADTVIVTRFFEAMGRMKKAISVIKKRTGFHEEALRELRIAKGGVLVGPVLEQFVGVFTGTPRYLGPASDILKDDKDQ
jgi:circadian clock protein KaiC